MSSGDAGKGRQIDCFFDGGTVDVFEDPYSDTTYLRLRSDVTTEELDRFTGSTSNIRDHIERIDQEISKLDTFVTEADFEGKEDSFSVTDALIKSYSDGKRTLGLRPKVTTQKLDYLIGLKQPLQQKLDALKNTSLIPVAPLTIISAAVTGKQTI